MDVAGLLIAAVSTAIAVAAFVRSGRSEKRASVAEDQARAASRRAERSSLASQLAAVASDAAIAVDTATPNRAAAARHEAPSSTARITRSRRSFE